MREKSLHAAIKQWYALPGDKLETRIGSYVVDIVRGELLIEIQTSSFAALRRKLSALTKNHPVRLVHPIAQAKWIVRLDEDGEAVLSRRKSPKKGRVEDVFWELVSFPRLAANPNFSLEVLLIHAEEILINDGRGSWRRKGWSIYDRRLLEVIERVVLATPANFGALLPPALPEQFTNKELAGALKIRLKLAQKMSYCLRHMGAIGVAGKRGRAILYNKR